MLIQLIRASVIEAIQYWRKRIASTIFTESFGPRWDHRKLLPICYDGKEKLHIFNHKVVDSMELVSSTTATCLILVCQFKHTTTEPNIFQAIMDLAAAN